MHYGVGVVPARPYKPRDKAKVETGVQLAERWIIAALRHRKFFSIEELNQAIRELRDRINQRPFRKREGSRAAQFAAVDKPALSPLPAERFDLSEWSRARVNIDYHIAFDTQLLQRALQPGARTGGGTLDADDHRDLPQGPARGVTPTRTRPRARRHDCRAPSAFPPGALASPEKCQAAHTERLRRGDRLSHCSRTGQERDPFSDATVRLECGITREHLRPWTNGRRQEFRGLRSGAEGMPRWLLCALHPRPVAVPRSGDGAGRRQLAQSAGAAQPHRCPGDRRLGHGSAVEPERRDFWEICEDRYQSALDDPDLATAGLALARTDRRSDAGRRHPRPAGSQRAPHRDARGFDA